MQPGKKILVVDDDDFIRDFLCELFALSGFDVSCCPDGPSALKAAEKKIFDIVISDYNMPAMTGAEVARRLRGLFPCSVIIGVSSDCRKDDFLNAGADAFLQKPYTHTQLIALIKKEISLSE